MDIGLLRGRSSYPMPVQHAEIALRQQLGETTLAGVRFMSRTTGDDGVVTSVFAARGGQHTVRVRTTRSAETQRLTCSATRENPLVQHELLGIDSTDPTQP